MPSLKSVALSLLAAALPLAAMPAAAQATSAPTAVPDPVAQVAAGTGTASTPTCTTGVASTSGVNLGDGCAPATAGVAAPQGVSVDRLGNLYIADYNDRQIRVVYNAGTQLAAAITAANSGYAISSTRNAPATVPVAGNIYTLAGFGSTATSSITAAGTTYPCANYAATGQPTGLNALGDGCPAASAPIGPRAVTPDADGNLFLIDYANSRVRVLCVNCATTTAAAQLITLENPGVMPVNGAMYTIVGFAGGYRDAAPGFASATAATVNVALLRSPTAVSISSADDVYIADQGNNAIRLLYNGGAPALALLSAQGVTPTVGNVYTIVGAGCVSAAVGKTGSVSSANSCLTLTAGADGTLGSASGVNTPWSIYLDVNGNLYFGDSGNSHYRALYGGILNPLPVTGTLTLGAVYNVAGGGTSTANGIAPSQLALAATAAQGISGDASGNLFLQSFTAPYAIYELYANTNTLTAIVGPTASATTFTAGVACGASATPVSINAFGDGCPATQSKLLSPRGSIAVDSANNLYFGDSADNIVQKYTYPVFPQTSVGATSAAQLAAFTFNAAATTILNATADYTASAGPCAGANAAGGTCAATVVFTPAHPGLRPGALRLTLADGTRTANELLAATATGAALNADLATPVTVGTGLQPNAVAIDAAGNLLVADLAGKSVVRYAATTSTTVATGFTTPSGIAVDAAGNIFVADSTTNRITEIPTLAGTTPFTLVANLKAPRGLAIDAGGNLLIANTGTNQVLTVAPNGTIASVVPFTGLNAPQAVAVDAAGNVYAADTGNARIVRLSPAGTQTAVASTASTGLAVDPAGDLFAFSGTALNEYLPGSTTPIAVLSGLTSARGVAIDATGNLAIADSSQTGLLTLNRTVAAYTFTSSPSSTPFTLTSSGNATFVPAATFLTNSDSTHFTVTPATTNGCSGSLPSGTSCNLTATFAATISGTYTDSVVFNGNATNAPGLALTGTNTAEQTTTTFTTSATTVTYGKSITLTATVKGTATVPSTGTVAFRNATTTLATANVGSTGMATATVILPAGAQSITAVYTPSTINYQPSTSGPTVITVTPAALTATATNTSRQFGVANPAFTYTLSGFVNGDTQASATTGTPTETTTATAASPQGPYPIAIAQGTLAAANYTFAFTPGTLTVTPAVPAVAFTASTTNLFGGQSVTLSATITSTVGTPTGSVTFFSGLTSLAVVPLTGNTATLITTALPVGTDSVTAMYSGDPAFATNTSAAILITVGVPFSISSSSTALTFPHNYQEAQSILTINPGGRTDTFTFSCNGLPAKVSCAFSPATLALNGLVGPQPVTLLLSNSSATASNQIASPGAFAAGIAFLLLLATRRRKLLPHLLGLFVIATLAGCGSSSTATQQQAGTYTFNVVVSSGSATVQTLPFTLTIQ